MVLHIITNGNVVHILYKLQLGPDGFSDIKRVRKGGVALL